MGRGKLPERIEAGGGSWAVERQLGEGAFARVYRCSGREGPVAVKVRLSLPCRFFRSPLRTNAMCPHSLLCSCSVVCFFSRSPFFSLFSSLLVSFPFR